MAFSSCTRTAVIAAIDLLIVMVTMADSKAGCCYYDQYEGHLYITTGTYDQTKNAASLVRTDATIHLDHTKQMVSLKAVGTTDPGGVIRAYTIIEDLNKQQGWYIQGKSCFKIPANFHVPAQCIPDGSKLQGRSNIGDSGESVWTWVLPKEGTSVLRRLTTAVEGCVPIQSLNVEFNKNSSSMTTTQYGNMTKGIADPSIFDIPAFCPQ